MSEPTAIERARVALAAASRSEGPLRTHYLAAARVAADKAREELREVTWALDAAEAALLGTGPAQGSLDVGRP